MKINDGIRYVKEETRKFFKRMLYKEAKPIIKAAQSEGPISKEQKRAILKQVAKEMKRKARRYAVGLFLTTVLASSATFMLKDGVNGIDENSVAVNIDLNKTDKKDVNINNFNKDKMLFINGLKVEEDTLKTHESSIRKEVEKEVSALETKEDVLNYIKEIYVKDYIETNKENIKKEDIEFAKTLDLRGLKFDKTENGEKIIRRTDSNKQDIYYSNGLIKIKIKTPNGIKQEETVGDLKDYYKVYNDKEQNKEDLLAIKYGAIIDTGIDYAFIKNKDKCENKIYEDRFVEKITKYKMSKIDELAKPNVSEKSERE